MNNKLIFTTALTLALACHWAPAQDAAAPPPAAKDGLTLTVYNEGLGVVKEVRKLQVPAGGEVQYADVAGQIDPTSVHFRSLTDPKAKLLEQNFQFDLVSAERLLQRYLGKPIEAVLKDGKSYTGKLLSFDENQLILQDDKGALSMVQRADNVRDIRFGSLPEGLLIRPTLVWRVAAGAGEHQAEVTYQTAGLTWHAEYVLNVNAADTAADLAGWISVQNDSGKTYKDARLKFVAGDVHRAPTQAPARGSRFDKGGGEGEGVQERAFFEYHLYALDRPSTVADHEIKQLEMFAPVREIKVAKKFLYNPLAEFRWQYGGGPNEDRSYGVQSHKKVNVFIEFRNAKENGLGMPLPAGKVRVYKADTDKAQEFVGEEMIQHTPKDEDLSLQIGNAFDLVGERTQTDFKVESGRNWMSETVQIKLRNHKKEDVVIRVKEPMYRWFNWKITNTNQKEYKKLDAFTVAWDLPVKADGETVLNYTVEYTW